MQTVTAQPYAKRPVPDPDGEKSLAAWAAKIASYLGIEFANVQRGQARAGSRTVTDAYTATANDGLILADATSAPFEVTLPDPMAAKDTVLTIKRLNGGGNAVTVGGTVDGTLNPTLGAQWASKTVWSSGAAWYTVATV